jgi:hypothetical protein
MHHLGKPGEAFTWRTPDFAAEIFEGTRLVRGLLAD